MTPELVSLLNTYTVPAGICDDQGNWVALSNKLQNLLAKNFRDNLAGYVAGDAEWQNTWNTISGKRQVRLVETRFTPPLAEKLAQVTRIDFLGSQSTNYLVEFYSRSEHIGGLPQQPLSVRNKLSSQRRAMEQSRQLALRTVAPPTDALTGLPDRIAFERQLNHQWNLALCQRTDLALLLLDVELCNWTRDTQDDYLRRIARCLKGSASRWSDFVARTGDGLFAIILPATDGDGATALAERLLKAIEPPDSQAPSANEVPTVSIGFHSCRPTPSTDVAELYRRADNALYRARDYGRSSAVNYTAANTPRETTTY